MTNNLAVLCDCEHTACLALQQQMKLKTAQVVGIQLTVCPKTHVLF